MILGAPASPTRDQALDGQRNAITVAGWNGYARSFLTHMATQRAHTQHLPEPGHGHLVEKVLVFKLCEQHNAALQQKFFQIAHLDVIVTISAPGTLPPP